MRDVKVGDRLKFEGGRNSYVVRARTDRYIICTKPFAARRTFIYTIVDTVERMRGPDNYLWAKYDYTDPEDLKQAVADLESGDLALSPRRSIPLKRFEPLGVTRK